jgi:hypothetical protein
MDMHRLQLLVGPGATKLGAHQVAESFYQFKQYLRTFIHVATSPLGTRIFARQRRAAPLKIARRAFRGRG